MRAETGSLLRLLSDAMARRYLVLGAATTAAGFGLILLLRPHLGEHAANALAYVLMTPIAFGLHRRFAFNHHGAACEAFSRYVAALGFAVVVNQIALQGAVNAGLAGVPAQAVAVCAGVIVQLLVTRLLVFPTHEGQP